ncbi:hypothetical protein ACFQ1I_43785 [Kitasatospora arboriphila]
MDTGAGGRELYEGLTEGAGPGAHREVALPWLAETGRAYRERLHTAAACSGWWQDRRTDERVGVLHMELYALGRVNDVLLLARQTPAARGTRASRGSRSPTRSTSGSSPASA